jgi:hypothetical protein
MLDPNHCEQTSSGFSQLSGLHSPALVSVSWTPGREERRGFDARAPHVCFRPREFQTLYVSRYASFKS